MSREEGSKSIMYCWEVPGRAYFYLQRRYVLNMSDFFSALRFCWDFCNRVMVKFNTDIMYCFQNVLLCSMEKNLYSFR